MFYYKKNYKIVPGEGKSRRAAPVSREQPGQTEQNRVRVENDGSGQQPTERAQCRLTGAQ